MERGYQVACILLAGSDTGNTNEPEGWKELRTQDRPTRCRQGWTALGVSAAGQFNERYENSARILEATTRTTETISVVPKYW